MTNKNKPPTKTDREILKFLQNGGTLNWRTAYQMFGTSRLADNIYRLRGNGYDIPDGVPVYCKPGTNKHYFNFSMVKPEIKAAGQKVEKVMKGKTVSDYSRDMARVAEKPPVVQQSMFGEVAMP